MARRKTGSPGGGDILVGWSLEDERRQAVGFAGSARADAAKPLFLGGEGHAVTVAPTGGGKGRSALIPTLLTYEGAVIVIDPKGENLAVTARRRREMGHRVIVLDPMGVTGVESDRLNPLDAVTAFAPCDVDDVAALVSGLTGIYSEPRDAFWANRAADLIIGATMHVLAEERPDSRNLCRVREIVSSAVRPSERIEAMMADSSHPEARMAAQSFCAPGETMGGIVSFALDALGFLRGEEVRASVSSSTFDLASVTAGEPLSIFLVLPPDKLASHGRLLRLWISALMGAVVRRQRRPALSTLFLLDEAAQLGTLPHLRQAMTLLRSYGLSTWSFWQDASQLRQLYPADWPTMLSNCKAVQVFGANSMMAARNVADITGFDDPARILSLKPGEMILQIAGREAMVARKPDYLKDAAFTGLADPNPFYATSGAICPPPRPLRPPAPRAAPPKRRAPFPWILDEAPPEPPAGPPGAGALAEQLRRRRVARQAEAAEPAGGPSPE